LKALEDILKVKKQLRLQRNTMGELINVTEADVLTELYSDKARASWSYITCHRSSIR